MMEHRVGSSASLDSMDVVVDPLMERLAQRQAEEERQDDQFDRGNEVEHLPKALRNASISAPDLTNIPPVSDPPTPVLDMNQPWQRSLVKELEEIEKNQRQPKFIKRRERVLLGHTKSTDFAASVNGEDDFTLTTDASSTIPIKPQNVHRKAFIQALLADDDGEEDMTSYHKLSDPPPPPTPESPNCVRRHPSDFEASQDDEKLMQPSPSSDSLDDGTPKQGSRASSQSRARSSRGQETASEASANLQQPWLEMEPDDNKLAVDSLVAEESCFCGYNILDFWLKPPSSPKGKSYRMKRRQRGSVKMQPSLRGVEEVVEEVLLETAEGSSNGPSDPVGTYQEPSITYAPRVSSHRY